MFGKLSKARENVGSPLKESQRPGTGSERPEADGIGSRQLRGESGKKARCGEYLLDIEEYVVISEGGGERAEGVGRKGGEKVKMGKGLQDT